MSNDQTPTTAQTRAAATQADALPKSGIVLLGTITAEGTARALIRDTDGTVAKVSPGDRIGAQTVAAIEQGQMILMKDGETSRMVIPGS